MIKRLRQLIENQDSLEKALFWLIFLVVAAAAVVSTIFTTYEGLSNYASITSMAFCVACGAVGFVAVKTRLFAQCYMVMCLMLNCIVIPTLFFFCGGFKSGMVFYCLISVVLCAYCRGKSKWIIFAISMVAAELSFVLSRCYPEHVVQLSEDAAFLDMVVSFFIMSVVGFVITSYAHRSYNAERMNKEKMLSRLEYLSKNDSLTGLYKRRYLIHYVENIVWGQREQYCLFLIDIDGLRQINETFGHMVGDKILVDISRMALSEFDDGHDVGCARYNGATILGVVNAESEVEAISQLDRFREKVAQVRWDGAPGVSVSITGSVVYCGNKNIKTAAASITKLENLFIEAKKRGRGRILGQE